MKQIIKTHSLLYVIAITVLHAFLTSCSKDDEEVNPMIVGYWGLVTIDYYVNGEMSTVSNPVYKIFHFTNEGTYASYSYDRISSTLNGPYPSNYSWNWSFNSKNNKLQLVGNEYFTVLDVTSSYLTLKKGEGNIYQIEKYEKLSEADMEYFRGGGGSQGTTTGVPTSISGKYIHLYRSDGQKLIIKHLNSSAATVENQVYVSYKDGYAPTYRYSRTDSKNAYYYFKWTPLTYIGSGITMESNKQYLEIDLSFNASDNTRGTFSGTTWIEGWNWSTNTEYRKNETKCTGKFYLGKETDPEY